MSQLIERAVLFGQPNDTVAWSLLIIWTISVSVQCHPSINNIYCTLSAKPEEDTSPPSSFAPKCLLHTTRKYFTFSQYCTFFFFWLVDLFLTSTPRNFYWLSRALCQCHVLSLLTLLSALVYSYHIIYLLISVVLLTKPFNLSLLWFFMSHRCTLLHWQ